MWILFLKTLKDNWKLVMILSVSSISFLAIYVLLFPTIAKQAPDFEKLLSQYPKELWSLFGIKESSFGIGSLEEFLSSKHFSMLWPIMTLGLTISLGVGAIAGEIESKTMEILLSIPVSRIKVLLAKILGGSLLIVVYTALSVLVVAPMVKIFNIEGRIDVYLPLFILGVLFAICTYSIATMFSAFFSKGKVSLMVIGIMLVMYVMTIISTLVSSLSDIKYFSLFYYFDTSTVIAENAVPAASVAVFVLTSIICFGVSIWYFNKRDVAL